MLMPATKEGGIMDIARIVVAVCLGIAWVVEQITRKK